VLICCEVGDLLSQPPHLASVVIAAALAQHLRLTKTRYSYRLLFVPHSLGSFTWLALNQSSAFRVKHSLVLDGAGINEVPLHSDSRLGDAKSDHAVAHVLTGMCGHPSAVNLEGAVDTAAAIEPECLHDALQGLITVVDVLEDNRVYVSGSEGEWEFTDRGLLRLLTGGGDDDHRRALIAVLNSSDGQRSLLDIAREGDLRWDAVKSAAGALVTYGLIKPIVPSRIAVPAARLPVKRTLN